MSDVQIRMADWHKDNADLRRIRESVFIQEQGVTPEQEWIAMMRRPLTFSPVKVTLL